MIKITTKSNILPLNQVAENTVFKYENSYYLKIDMPLSDSPIKYNRDLIYAINLSGGFVCWFTDTDTKVTVYPSVELIIDETISTNR